VTGKDKGDERYFNLVADHWCVGLCPGLASAQTGHIHLNAARLSGFGQEEKNQNHGIDKTIREPSRLPAGRLKETMQ